MPKPRRATRRPDPKPEQVQESITKRLTYDDRRDEFYYHSRKSGEWLPEHRWPAGLWAYLLNQVDQEGRAPLYELLERHAEAAGITPPRPDLAGQVTTA